MHSKTVTTSNNFFLFTVMVVIILLLFPVNHIRSSQDEPSYIRKIFHNSDSQNETCFYAVSYLTLNVTECQNTDKKKKNVA